MVCSKFQTLKKINCLTLKVFFDVDFLRWCVMDIKSSYPPAFPWWPGIFRDPSTPLCFLIKVGSSEEPHLCCSPHEDQGPPQVCLESHRLCSCVVRGWVRRKHISLLRELQSLQNEVLDGICTTHPCHCRTNHTSSHQINSTTLKLTQYKQFLQARQVQTKLAISKSVYALPN